MMVRLVAALALVLGLGLGLVATWQPAAAQQAVTVNLGAQNNSGVSGTATLTPMGNQTQVVIRVTGEPAGASEPAHIHDGTCANLNPTPKYPLNNVENGTSTTMVNATLAQIQSSATAINLHESAQNISRYVACGNIPVATAAPASGATTSTGLPRTGEQFPLAAAAGLTLTALGCLLGGWGLRRRSRPD